MFSGKKIVIAGGSGYIGQAMAERWGADNNVIILTRGPGHEANNAYSRESAANNQHLHWDGKRPGDWTTALKGADLLINLSGKSVNCRYTARNKRTIMSSRGDATNALGEAVRSCTVPPKLWINMSSATIYRHAEDRPQDEATGEMHNDFSVRVCKAWEAAFNAQSIPYTRKVVLRSAIVLGDGGVLVPFKRLALAGLGGHQGSGRQMFSWIHMEDLCRIVEWIAGHPEEEGIYNASAPYPLTNRDFMAALRQKLHMPYGLSAPAWLLRIGAMIIGTETELLLKSRWVIPARLLGEGFKFQYPTIKAALNNLLSDSPVGTAYVHASS